MELSKAIEILKVLENGANPFTGEVFPENTVYQHPDTVRALGVALKVMEAALGESKTIKKLPEFAGRPWSDIEDDKLLKEFDSDKPVKDISIKHKRTTGAIQSRLMKLGRIKG